MDSDGVFVSDVFKQWLGENNIRPEYCQPRRHQQNGAAEASIKSINDMARCMLVASGLPGKYWGYAVHHAAFVRNRVVSSNLDASPYFKAFNKQPDLKMLQEFGSEVYALNDDARKFKLGDKTVKGRFLGYSVDTGSPSALVLLKSGKVLRSRDVVFSPTSAQLAQWELTETDPLDWLDAQAQSGSVGAADAPVSQQWEPVSDEDSSAAEPVPDLQPEASDVESVASVGAADTDSDSADSPSASLDFEDCAVDLWDPSVAADIQQAIYHHNPAASGSSYQLVPAANDSSELLVAPSEAWRSGKDNGPSQAHMQSYTQACPEGVATRSQLAGSSHNASAQHALISARFKHMEQSQWEDGVREIALSMVTPGEAPKSVKQALNGPQASHWEKAIYDEFESFDTPVGDQGLKCMELVDVKDVPSGACILDSKYEFKWKEPIGDCPARARARLCICGNQEEMEEDDNTFAPVARMTTARILFSMAVQNDLEAEVSDISTAFPNASVPDNKDVYMAIPEGAHIYHKGDLKGKYFRVNQALYGLKKSPRAFNQYLHAWMIKQGFCQSEIDPCLYFRDDGTSSPGPSSAQMQDAKGQWNGIKPKALAAGKMLFVLIYVDDCMMVGNSSLVNAFKKELDDKYKMRHHGPISVYTGLEFNRNRPARTGSIGMGKYVDNLAKEFLPVDYMPVSSPSTEADAFSKEDEPTAEAEVLEMSRLPYRRLVACLLWVATSVRCDTALPVKKLTQHFNNPGKKMWKSALKTLVYLKTVDISLQYGVGPKDAPALKIYVDADYASERATRKSTSGVMAYHQTNLVNWLIRNQKSVALSTMEAEYMALCEASKEAMYLKQLFKELSLSKPSEPAYLMEDNEACKLIASDAKHHNRAKHIDVQYHFSRDCQQQGLTKVLAVHTQRQLADMLTKYVRPNVLQRLTWVAFGYYPEFHLQNPKTPLVSPDGLQFVLPDNVKPPPSLGKIPKCFKMLPQVKGYNKTHKLHAPAAAALAKLTATHSPNLSPMNSKGFTVEK